MNANKCLLKKVHFRMSYNIENIIMIIIKHLEINQVSALADPLGVDMPLNKWFVP